MANKKYISYAWIRTIVHQAVGLQESALDHSPPRIVYILEQLPYICSTCAHQIKIPRPLGGLHCNHYASLARPLVCTIILHDPLVCTVSL